MRHGKFVVRVTTINQRGEKVLEGTSEVAQPTTPSTPSPAKVRRSREWEWTCITLPWRPMRFGTYDTTDKDGNIKSLPLFTDINVRTLRHTFTHPKGLLFATQFAQIALVTPRAAFEDM